MSSHYQELTPRRIVVAVSGGLDSMVLLHRLHRLSGAENWQLVVAHLNHGLRGRASDADEQFVRTTAARLGLPCVSERADVATHARTRRLSLEMAGRELRHAFLARVARQHGARVVALAHHADDQVETFLLRLFRGAGGDGLGGMQPVAPSPADPGVSLVRPLLAIPRARLAAFARRHRLQFSEDASNRDRRILRNRLRLDWLPRLRRIIPAVDAAILRAAELVGAEAQLAAAAAQHWLRRRQRSPFAALAVAVQRRVIQAQLRQLGCEPDFTLIETLRVAAGRRIVVRPGLNVLRDSLRPGSDDSRGRSSTSRLTPLTKPASAPPSMLRGAPETPKSPPSSTAANRVAWSKSFAWPCQPPAGMFKVPPI